MGKGSHYTEECHLEGRSPIVRDLYTKLKSTFLSTGSPVNFKPVKGSIRIWIGKRRNIAEIFFRKETLDLECRRLGKNDTGGILKHHTVRHYVHPGIICERVKICDTDHWDEIQKLITRLVIRHQLT